MTLGVPSWKLSQIPDLDASTLEDAMAIIGGITSGVRQAGSTIATAVGAAEDVPVPGSPSGYADVLARLGITPTPGMEPGPPGGYVRTAPPLLGGQGEPYPEAQPLGTILKRGLSGATASAVTEGRDLPIVRDLPDPIRALLGTGIEEATRPINYAAAPIRGLTFAPKAGLAARAAGEVGAAVGGRLAGEGAAKAGEGLPEPFRTGATLAGGIAGVAAGGLGAARSPQILRAIDERALTKLPGSMGTGATERMITRHGVGPTAKAGGAETEAQRLASNTLRRQVSEFESFPADVAVNWKHGTSTLGLPPSIADAVEKMGAKLSITRHADGTFAVVNEATGGVQIFGNAEKAVRYAQDVAEEAIKRQNAFLAAGAPLDEVNLSRETAPPRLPPSPPSGAGGGALPPGKPPSARVGNLVRAPQKVDTVQESIAAARNMRREAESGQVSLMAEATNARRVLGMVKKGKDGNLYLKDVMAPDGSPALLQDVLENPHRYALDEKQASAVQRFQGVGKTARTEAGVHEVPNLHEVGLEEGQNFIPRLVTRTTKVELEDKGARGGARLAARQDRPRQFTDPLEAVREGVVYADPVEAMSRYTRTNLMNAANVAHRDLLVPFSETAATRVPAPLRAKHDVLTQSLSSLKATYGRLDERLHGVIASYRNAAEPDLDALWDELEAIKVGASATGKIGRNFGKDAAAMRKEIAGVQKAIKEMAPEWRRAVRQSRLVLPGRETVGIDVAPLLSGRDFAAADARALRRFYSNGILPDNAIGDVLRFVGGVSQKIVPARAIGDASATLKQLGTIFPRHPVQFARNFGKAASDSMFPGGQVRYNEWLAEERTRYAASRGVTLLGHAGQGSDFYASWFERIPILRETQRHFASISNRNRVDLFYADRGLAEKVAAKGGKVSFDDAEEAVARNSNRVTGIANTRATDAETLSEFAANWLRSRLETLSRAATDGGIEGQLAREYLGTYVFTGLMMATGVAAMQKRDLRDVLSPITVRDDGRFYLNPNFGTVRLFGQDISLFGSYVDLARLSVAAADAAAGAINERDATQLFDAIGYAARTKGAPWLTAGINYWLGENIVGQTTRSLYGAAREIAPVPFTVTGAADQIQRGAAPLDVAADTALNFFGASSNPLSTTERLNKAAEERFGKVFLDLSAQQQDALVAENPDFGQRAASMLMLYPGGINDKFWPTVKEKMGLEGKNYADWKKGKTEEFREAFEDRGIPKLEAKALADKVMRDHKAVKAMEDIGDAYRKLVIATRPNIARAAAEQGWMGATGVLAGAAP